MKSIQKLFYHIIYVLSFITILSTTLLAQAPDTLWTKTFRDSCDYVGNCVQITTDGGYIMAGTKGCYNKWGEILLIKTDAFGDTLWTKKLENTLSHGGKSGQQTNDGGYIILGFTQSPNSGKDILLIKTDASGNMQWTKPMEAEVMIMVSQ
jgi:hypothetical protein